MRGRMMVLLRLRWWLLGMIKMKCWRIAIAVRCRSFSSSSRWIKLANHNNGREVLRRCTTMKGALSSNDLRSYALITNSTRLDYFRATVEKEVKGISSCTVEMRSYSSTSKCFMSLRRWSSHETYRMKSVFDSREILRRLSRWLNLAGRSRR